MGQKKPCAIGIDMGGTSIRLCLVNQRGLLGSIEVVPTHAKLGPDRIIKHITSKIHELVAHCDHSSDIIGVGIGAPGPLNETSGIIHSMPNLPGWSSYPLKLSLQEATGFNVEILNDADAAAWGEHAFGSAKEHQTFFLVTLGTGVGSSLFINGCHWIGDSGVSAEFGHIPISRSRKVCSCGRSGHLESFVSSKAIIERYWILKRSLELEHSSCEYDKQQMINVERIVVLARGGDRSALESMRRYSRYLGQGLAIIGNLLNISLVIIGGGISAAFDLMEPMLLVETQRYMFEIQAQAMKFRSAFLGGAAGVIGAGYWFLRKGRVFDSGGRESSSDQSHQ